MNRITVFKCIITCVLFIVLSGPGSAFGQSTVVWTGHGDGESWADASNWDTEFVPGPLDEAIIDLQSVPFFRIQVQKASVAGLTLATTRASIEIIGELVVSESLTFDGGTIEGDGTLIVEGKFTWIQGNMYGSGATVLLGRTVIRRQSFRGLPIDRRYIEVHDVMVFEQGHVAPRNGATIVIAEGATLELGEAASGIQPGSAASQRPRLINKGLIVKRDGPSSEGAIGMSTQFGDALDIENYGEVRAEVGTLLYYLSDGSINEGVIVSDANISINNAHGLNAEAVELGGTLRGTGGFQFFNAVDLTGELDVEGELLVRDGTTFTEQLNITRAGTIYVNTNNFTEYVFALNIPGKTQVGTLQVDGRFHLTGALVVENLLAIGIGNTAEITGSGSITMLPNADTYFGYGFIEGLSAIRTQKAFSIPALIMAGDFFDAQSALTLTGTDLFVEDDGVWDDGDLTLEAGATLVIGENAVFDLQRDGQISYGMDATGDERIVNNGTLRKSGIGRLARYEWGMDEPEYNDSDSGTQISVQFVNAGTLSLEAGTTSFRNVLRQEGTIQGTHTLDLAEAKVQAADGVIAPGAPIGTLPVRGHVDLNDQRLQIEIAGDPTDGAFDALKVDGDLRLGGRLEVSFIDYQPQPGDVYEIASAAGTISGDFTEVNLPQIAGISLNLQVDDGVVRLDVEGSDEVLPVLAVDPVEIEFPETEVGKASSQVLTIANEGEGPLFIESIALDRDDAPFSIGSSESTVAAGERVEVELTFTPAVAGQFDALLIIRSNGGSADIRLAGTGTEADVPLPVLAVDPVEIEFPETEVGKASSQVLTIANRGEADLLISSIEFNQEDIPVFWSTFDSTLVAGDSLELALTFQPAEPGSYEAVLRISSNGGSADIHISGTSSTAEIPTPIAVDDEATTFRGEPVVVDVLANDSDPEGESLTIVEVGQPTSGRASTDGRAITYTPSASFVGTDSFRYVIENAGGGRAGATITVTVVGFGFSIVEVSPEEGVAARATAISPNGIVAGVTLTSRGIAPFIWSDDQSTTVDIDGYAVTPYAVGDDAVMAGVAVEADSSALAVLFRSDGSLRPLGNLGGEFGIAYAMNDRGAVAGVSLTEQARFQAFVWNDDLRAVELGDGSHSEAFAINNQGSLAGVVTTEDGTDYAVVNGRAVATAETRAYDLNNFGMSVGSALSGGQVVPMAWNSEGEPKPYRTGGADFAEAYAVSDAGWAVGVTSRSSAAHKTTTSAADQWSRGARHAMRIELPAETAGKSSNDASLRASLWVDGTQHFLDQFIHDPEGSWQLLEARDVNARGQIVGYGLRDGRTAAYLLTPIDAETPLANHVVREAYPGTDLTISVDDLARTANGDSLIVLGTEEASFGSVEVAADGRSLTYRPLGGGPASDVFTAFVGNGRGSAVEARVEIALRAFDDAAGTLQLQPNFPNPFSTTSHIGFAVHEAAHVRLALYDLLGRRVQVVLDAHVAAGRHEFALSADGLASGTYILRLSSGQHVDSRTVNVLR